jgi:dienelactone hydrolase
MRLQNLWPTVRFCLVVFCSAAALAASGNTQLVSAPAPTGASQVGTLWQRLVDVSRNDPFLQNGAKRELMVRFWYPAAQGRCAPAEYASPKVWAYLSQISGFPLPKIKTNSCLQSGVAAGIHPVIVFSPGFTGMLTDATFLFEELASRGYVVASIAHTHESTAVEFPDGRLITSSFGSYLAPQTLRADPESLALVRSARLDDVKFVLNELWRLDTSLGSAFHNRLDLAHIAVMGHSLGGEVALSILQRESRVRAAVWIDGVISDESAAGTDKPVLLLAAGREQWNQDECRLWSNLRGIRRAVNLRGAEHLTPSDAVWLGRAIPGMAVAAGAAGSARTIAAIRNQVTAFFDSALRDRPFAFSLTGVTLDNRAVTVTAATQPLCHQLAEKGEPQ